MAIVLHWFRRDLRLVDNTALSEALKAGQVLAVFVLDPSILRRPDTGGARVAFLYDGLRELDRELRARRSQLLLRRGHPASVLTDIAREHNATACFFNRDYEPYATLRDAEVTRALAAEGVTVRSFKDDVIAELGELPGPRPFRVFTPFFRAWGTAMSAASLSQRPTEGNFLAASAFSSQSMPPPAATRSGQLPTLPAGHHAAVDILQRFERRPLSDYARDRDLLDRPSTSRISAHLRFGMISLRECLRLATRQHGRGGEAWVRQLAWRDFYRQLLAGMPRLEREPMDTRMAALAWQDDSGALQAWKEGRTGYPVVDAAMRQLAAEAWLPNRARMTVASFLVKDLGLHWQLGERFFMDRLLDGDLANNNGGWQWVAGTGADAQPYFRVFNPVLQGRRFDPDGVYVRRWCPELAAVPSSHVHEPWSLTESEQRRVGCLIGRDYPAPIVDHQEARRAALARYSSLTATAGVSASEPRSLA